MRLKQKIIYKNSKNEKIKLILESWAEEYNIESEIDRVVIYGW